MDSENTHKCSQAKRKNTHENGKDPGRAEVAKRKSKEADELSRTDADGSNEQRCSVHQLDFGMALQKHERDVANQAADAEIDVAERVLLRLPEEELVRHGS